MANPSVTPDVSSVDPYNKKSFFSSHYISILFGCIVLFLVIFGAYYWYSTVSRNNTEQSDITKVNISDSQLYNNVSSEEKQILLETVPNKDKPVIADSPAPEKDGGSGAQTSSADYITKISETNDSVVFNTKKYSVARMVVTKDGSQSEIKYLGYGNQFDSKKILNESLNPGDKYKIVVLDIKADNPIAESDTYTFQSGRTVR